MTDTLAWAAPRSGHWATARIATRRALRYGTDDARARVRSAG
jgi:hypothetical protein